MGDDRRQYLLAVRNQPAFSLISIPVDVVRHDADGSRVFVRGIGANEGAERAVPQLAVRSTPWVQISTVELQAVISALPVIGGDVQPGESNVQQRDDAVGRTHAAQQHNKRSHSPAEGDQLVPQVIGVDGRVSCDRSGRVPIGLLDLVTRM
jgi:hypothetical protein